MKRSIEIYCPNAKNTAQMSYSALSKWDSPATQMDKRVFLMRCRPCFKELQNVFFFETLKKTSFIFVYIFCLRTRKQENKETRKHGTDVAYGITFRYFLVNHQPLKWIKSVSDLLMRCRPCAKELQNVFFIKTSIFFVYILRTKPNYAAVKEIFLRMTKNQAQLIYPHLVNPGISFAFTCCQFFNEL